MADSNLDTNIRVSIPSDLFAGETVWVALTGPRRGIVQNVCSANRRITLGDEIRFSDTDGLPRYTRMIKRSDYGMARFATREGANEDAVKVLISSLTDLGVQVEGMRIGQKGAALYGLAMPPQAKDAVLKAIQENPTVEIYEILR